MAGPTRKVTVNLPTDDLERAMQITGRGITETLLEGLREVERSGRRSALRKLKGKIAVDLDLEGTRR